MEQEFSEPGDLPQILSAPDLTPSSQPSLAITFSRCLSSYKRLLFALNKDNCRVIRLNQVNLQEILEEYGRLRIWGEQTKATLPERARGSLDDTLRHDPSLKEMVLENLDQLNDQLNLAIPIAEGGYDESRGSDQDSISNMSADSELSSGGEDGEANGPPEAPRVSKISILLHHILEQIRLLYRLSTLLRRPGLSGRYIRSTKDDRVSKISHFGPFDYGHVREKFFQWGRTSKASSAIREPDEECTTEAALQQRKQAEEAGSDKTDFLCRRLAEANSRRREQLLYWSHHSDTSEDQQRVIKSQSELSTVEAPGQKALPFAPTPSATSKQSFSTAARSAVFETHTQSGQPRTIYAQSTAGGKRSNRVPEVPSASQKGPKFDCPYCHLCLDSETMQNRVAWKSVPDNVQYHVCPADIHRRHVFRDLRPYTCTFPECQNPEKLYVTRHDWMYHELQVHRREWVCGGDCDETFPTKDLMIEHLQKTHADLFTERQLPILLDLGERPTPDNQTVACPLCPGAFYLTGLQSHLAEHMEEIALFVLPLNLGDDDDVASSKVAGASSNPAEGTSMDTSSLSSPGFSDVDSTQRPQQTNQDFAALFAMDELDANARISAWNADDGSNEDGYVSLGHGMSERPFPPPPDFAGRSNDLDPVLQGRSERAGSMVDLEQAEVEVQGLETRKSVLGQEHPDTLASMANLASTYRDQKRWEEAEELQAASAEGHDKIVELLLSKGADVNPERGKYGTALQATSAEGHDKIIELLLSKGADVNAQGGKYGNALQAASAEGHDKIVELLLSKGADVNAQGGKYGNALQAALEEGHDKIIELLLATSQVDPDSKDSSAWTPLSWAARNGHETVVKLLLATGQVNPDSKDYSGQTPLSWAAMRGNEAVVKLLLATGQVNPDSKDSSGQTPLSWAANNGHEAVVKLLLATSQVDPDSKDFNRRTPLSQVAADGHEAVVKLLLATGQVDPDSKDSSAWTPLSWAARNGHETVVKLLLATGQVNPDSKDYSGQTPLSWAAMWGNEAVVKLLLATGQVDPDSKDSNGWTPLLWAAARRHEAVVKLLLATGQVDPDSKDSDGRTPLSWAAEYGHEAVIKLLLATGQVDLDSKDNRGRTPLSRAAARGHEAVVKLLEQAAAHEH